MGIVDYFVSSGTTYAILLTLTKQDPEKLGKELAVILDTAVDSQVGDKRSKIIAKKLAPWGVRFWGSFIKELTKDIDYSEFSKKKKRSKKK